VMDGGRRLKLRRMEKVIKKRGEADFLLFFYVISLDAEG